MKKIAWKSISLMWLNDLKGGRLRLTPFSLVISALLLIMSVACSKDDGGISEPTTIPVSSIKLNQTSATLNVGESVDLTATVSPGNATNKTVTWSSSNTTVATVSNGKVTAVAVGSATITAQCGNVKAECSVTVNTTEVSPKSITLSQTSATLYVGGTIELTATVSPDNAKNKTVTWSSSDTKVATVTNGKVSAMSIGSATIIAQCGEVKAECTIIVKETEVTAITLSKTSVTLTVGETVELTAAISPEDATNKTVTWSSSDDKIATVTNGKVTAVAVGSATIIAQCGNIKAECAVIVSPIEATSIKLSQTSATLTVGESVQLTATVSPDNATDKSVTWSSSNTSVATVSNGKVTAVAVGSATITAQCGNVKAECTITVKATEVTSIKLNQTSATLYAGETVQLTATVSPENATNKTVTWSSSNTSVATVSNGKVTAVAVGSATITAQCGNVKAECTITVKPTEVTSIKLNQTSATLYAGETVQLTATVSPENATNKTVTWSSSNTSIATVTNGKVTAVAVGSATITAQCGNVKAECTITVKAIEVTSIKLNQTSATLYAGETVQLTATVSPENATNKTVTWSSSNTSVATVTNGKVTAIAVGAATITAQCGNVKAECTITVKAIDITSITLNKASVTLSAGETVQLTATISPNNATNKTVTWISSNTSVATVNNGKVTALAAGSATITAKTNNGLSATCSIAVVETVPPGGSEGTGEEEWK